MDEHILEMAAAAAAAQVQYAIDNRVQYQGESAEDCDSCGVEIPQARRLAVPGCRHCVDCQAMRERK